MATQFKKITPSIRNVMKTLEAQEGPVSVKSLAESCGYVLSGDIAPHIKFLIQHGYIEKTGKGRHTRIAFKNSLPSEEIRH